MGYVTPHVKMLKIKKSPGEPAYGPTVENTLNHTYPLGRSLHFYTPGKPEGAVKRFIDWVLSDAGQLIVQQSGFVPVRQITPIHP
jgi:phosphate transport system substrate-binding protein